MADLCVVVHTVRIGQNALAINYESAAGGCVLPLSLPR